MRRIEEIMEWIPVFFIAFKLVVLGTAAFFAINSHREGAKQEQREERERQARASATGSAISVAPDPVIEA